MGFNVYFAGRKVLTNLEESTIRDMYHKGWLRSRMDGDFELKYSDEFKHLFYTKTPLGKRLDYFKRINEMRLKCEDCGKSPSLHIRPDIDENGKVNFKTIICVCKECRTKKLKQQDILVPQFRRNLSNKALDEQIEKELREKYNSRIVHSLMSDKEFIQMKRKEKRIYSLTKISLPPLPKKRRSKSQEERMLREVGIESMTTVLDLNDKTTRVKVRKFLLYESFYNCPCCGKKTEYRYYTIDHIHPKSKGGPNTLENFIGMCKSCNKSKGDFTVLEYLQRVHFRALPYRVLKVAYKEQGRVKEELKEFQKELAEYEARLIAV